MTETEIIDLTIALLVNASLLGVMTGAVLAFFQRK